MTLTGKKHSKVLFYYRSLREHSCWQSNLHLAHCFSHWTNARKWSFSSFSMWVWNILRWDELCLKLFSVVVESRMALHDLQFVPHTGSSRFSKLCSYLDTQTSLIWKNLTWLIFIYMYNIITISLYNISIITRGRKSEHPREDSCSWNKTPGCLRLHNHTGPLRTGLYIKLHNYNIQRFFSQQKAIKYCFWDTLTATS